MRIVRITVIGRQGAGKGKQARRLAAFLQVPYVGTGDLLRAEAHSLTRYGEEIRQFQKRGELVREHIVFELLVKRLTSRDVGSGFVLDGYPRKSGQEETLARIIEPCSLDAAVYLDVSEDVARERIASRRVCTNRNCQAVYSLLEPPRDPWNCDSCGAAVAQRSDDAGSAVDRRMSQFDGVTRPLIEAYAAAGVLIHVDGLGSEDAVFARLAAHFGACGGKTE
jgi:adenylate kinase